MPEEQNELLDVREIEAFLRVKERMRDGVRQVLLCEIALEIKDVVAQPSQLAVLRLAVTPDQHMDLAALVGKMHRNLFAQKHAGTIGDGQDALDRIVVGDGHEIHLRRTQRVVELDGVGHAFREAGPAKDPFRRAVAGAGMDVEVGFHQGDRGGEVSATVAGAQEADPRTPGGRWRGQTAPGG